MLCRFNTWQTADEVGVPHAQGFLFANPRPHLRDPDLSPLDEDLEPAEEGGDEDLLPRAKIGTGE